LALGVLAMSNDSRSLVAVLVVCAMLLLVCVAVPLGVGAIFFVRLQAESQQQAVAIQQQALAIEQQALRQAEEARRQAELDRATMEKLMRPAAIPPLAPVAAPGENSKLTLEVRKSLYQQLKLVKDQLAAIEALGVDDPALKEVAAQSKAQFEAALDQIGTTAGITRKQLDEIMAEGEREKW
jgi:hypothetical protein